MCPFNANYICWLRATYNSRVVHLLQSACSYIFNHMVEQFNTSGFLSVPRWAGTCTLMGRPTHVSGDNLWPCACISTVSWVFDQYVNAGKPVSVPQYVRPPLAPREPPYVQRCSCSLSELSPTHWSAPLSPAWHPGKLKEEAGDWQEFRGEGGEGFEAK